LENGDTIGSGDLTIHVRINDPDLDSSPDQKDWLAQDLPDTLHGPVKISVLRGSEEIVLAYAGGTTPQNGIIDVNGDNPNDVRQLGPIQEIETDAGIFELDFVVRYTDGPSSPICPPTTRFSSLNFEVEPENELSRFDELFPSRENYCILQGDELEVEYVDVKDANRNTRITTDTATFDLRNGVLQSDQSVYVIGSDMILTLIEPDFDLDNDAAETYDLDLIEWDSDAATVTMGIAGGEAAAFDPEPSNFRETGDSTGIFQTVIEIPEELENDRLERGEEI
jgi:hypothetical protein